MMKNKDVDVCPNCGQQCSIDDVNCPKCGKNLDELFEQLETVEKAKNFQEKANNLNKRTSEFAQIIEWLAPLFFGILIIVDDIGADALAYIIFAIVAIGFLSSLTYFIKKIRTVFLIETYAFLGTGILFGIVTVISISEYSDYTIYYAGIALFCLIIGVSRLNKKV